MVGIVDCCGVGVLRCCCSRGILAFEVLCVRDCVMLDAGRYKDQLNNGVTMRGERARVDRDAYERDCRNK